MIHHIVFSNLKIIHIDNHNNLDILINYINLINFILDMTDTTTIINYLKAISTAVIDLNDKVKNLTTEVRLLKNIATDLKKDEFVSDPDEYMPASFDNSSVPLPQITTRKVSTLAGGSESTSSSTSASASSIKAEYKNHEQMVNLQLLKEDTSAILSNKMSSENIVAFKKFIASSPSLPCNWTNQNCVVEVTDVGAGDLVFLSVKHI